MKPFLGLGLIAILGCQTPQDVINSPRAREFTVAAPADDVVRRIVTEWSKNTPLVSVVQIEGGTRLMMPGPDVVVDVRPQGGRTRVRYGIRPLIHTPAWYEAPILALEAGA